MDEELKEAYRRLQKQERHDDFKIFVIGLRATDHGPVDVGSTSNDWRQYPDGQVYRSRLTQAGRGDLAGWLDGEFRRAIGEKLRAEAGSGAGLPARRARHDCPANGAGDSGGFSSCIVRNAPLKPACPAPFRRRLAAITSVVPRSTRSVPAIF